MAKGHGKEEPNASVNCNKSNVSQVKILGCRLEGAALFLWDAIDSDPSSTCSALDEAKCRDAYLNWIYQESLYDILDKNVALEFPDRVTKRRVFFNFSPMTTFLRKAYAKPANEVPIPEEDDCLPFESNGIDVGSVPSSPEWKQKSETTQDVLQNNTLPNFLDSLNEEQFLKNLERKLLNVNLSHEHSLESTQHLTATPVKLQPTIHTGDKMNLIEAEKLNGSKEDPKQQRRRALSFDQNSPLQPIAEKGFEKSPHDKARNILLNGHGSSKEQFVSEADYVEKQPPETTVQLDTSDISTSTMQNMITGFSPNAGGLEEEVMFFTPNSDSISKPNSGSGFYSTESTPKRRIQNTLLDELSKIQLTAKHGSEEKQIHYISPISVTPSNKQHSEGDHPVATHQNGLGSSCYSDTSMEYNRTITNNKIETEDMMPLAQSCDNKAPRLRTNAYTGRLEARELKGFRRALSYADSSPLQEEAQLNQAKTCLVKQAKLLNASKRKSLEQQISIQQESQKDSRGAGTIVSALQSALQSLSLLQSSNSKTSNDKVANGTINGGGLKCNANTVSVCNGNNQITGQHYPVASNGTCNLKSELTVPPIQRDPHEAATLVTPLCVENGSNLAQKLTTSSANHENCSEKNTNRTLERQSAYVNILTGSENKIDVFKMHTDVFAVNSEKHSANSECCSDSQDKMKKSSNFHLVNLNGYTIPSDQDCVESKSKRRPVDLNATMPMYIPKDSDRWTELDSQKEKRKSQQNHTVLNLYSNVDYKLKSPMMLPTPATSQRTPRANGISTPSAEVFSNSSSKKLNNLEFPLLGMTPSRPLLNNSAEALTRSSNNDIIANAQITPVRNGTCANGYISYSCILRNGSQTDQNLLNPVVAEAEEPIVQNSSEQTTHSTGQQEIMSEDCTVDFGRIC